MMMASFGLAGDTALLPETSRLVRALMKTCESTPVAYT